jgi:hypothetical protein
MWPRLLISVMALALALGVYFMVVEDMNIVWRAPQGQTL